jgi:hypothetical protein
VTSATKNLLRLRPYGSIRPPVAKIRNNMTPQETRRIVSITPIEQKPKPRTEFNDRRKRCVHCSNLATKDVVFKEEGVTVIERYCDSCIISLKLKIKKEMI